MPKQLKQTNVKEERERLLKEQDCICPLCGQEINPCDAALDHDHDTGHIRGVLHKVCNSGEGQMRSKFRRSGVAKHTTFEEYLLSLAEYLMKEQYPMLHPSHAPRPRKLQKRSYQELKREIEKLNKYVEKQVKVPDYPKSRRLTKRLSELFDMVKIYPKYYSK